MMKCKTFVEWVASGRVQALRAGDPDAQALAGSWLRLTLRVHPWACQRCRAFAHNNGLLTRLLVAQREEWRQWRDAQD
jgi:hypothetical protein